MTGEAARARREGIERSTGDNRGTGGDKEGDTGTHNADTKGKAYRRNKGLGKEQNESGGFEDTV